MGYFMDRHDFEAATAADVAGAHISDLAAQARYGVRFLSYWFDYERNAAFCLVEAPDAEAAQAVHRDSHGGWRTRSFPSIPMRWRASSGASTTPPSRSELPRAPSASSC